MARGARDIPTEYYIEIRVGKKHAFISMDNARELQLFVEPDGWIQTGNRLRHALNFEKAFEEKVVS